MVKVKVNFTKNRPEGEQRHEGISKILRTGAAISTAVVVARNTGRWWDYLV
jgi:hypothetical protein